MLKENEKEEIIRLDDEISLKDIIILLLRFKKIIIVITFAFAIGSVIVSLLMSATFQSTSKFITRTSNGSDVGALAQMASLAGMNISGGKGGLDPSKYLSDVVKDRVFLIKILNKRWYLRDSADSVLLEQLWNLKLDTTKEDWKYIFESQKVNMLRNGVFINLLKDKKTDVISLVSTFQTPELTFQVNNYILTLIAEYMRESFRFQAQEKRRFIELRIDEVFKDLEQSENNLASFKERNLNTSAPKVFLEEQRLVRNMSLNQELYLQLRKQYEIARIEEKNDQPLIEILHRPEIPILRASPQRKKIVAMGTISGFIVAMISALAWHWLHKTFLNK